MNAQHTTGPWTYTLEPGKLFRFSEFSVNGGNGQTVLLISDSRRLIPSVSDARLIAAAPDLLAALLDCITEDGALAERNHRFAMRRLGAINTIARSAIAKADGRSV